VTQTILKFLWFSLGTFIPLSVSLHCCPLHILWPPPTQHNLMIL
jgi:hypothetical protein